MCLKRKKDESHEMPNVCAFCEMATSVCDEEKLLCRKNGIVPASHKCRKFRYDPLKRQPKPPRQIPHDVVSIDD